jgi:acetyl-CoA C-acetyltransferase
MSKKIDDVVITSALRTPIGTYKGSLKNLSADKLGSVTIKEAILISNLSADQFDDAIKQRLYSIVYWRRHGYRYVC